MPAGAGAGARVGAGAGAGGAALGAEGEKPNANTFYGFWNHLYKEYHISYLSETFLYNLLIKDHWGLT